MEKSWAEDEAPRWKNASWNSDTVTAIAEHYNLIALVFIGFILFLSSLQWFVHSFCCPRLCRGRQGSSGSWSLSWRCQGWLSEGRHPNGKARRRRRRASLLTYGLYGAQTHSWQHPQRVCWQPAWPQNGGKWLWAVARSGIAGFIPSLPCLGLRPGKGGDARPQTGPNHPKVGFPGGICPVGSACPLCLAAGPRQSAGRAEHGASQPLLSGFIIFRRSRIWECAEPAPEPCQKKNILQASCNFQPCLTAQEIHLEPVSASGTRGSCATALGYERYFRSIRGALSEQTPGLKNKADVLHPEKCASQSYFALFTAKFRQLCLHWGAQHFAEHRTNLWMSWPSTRCHAQSSSWCFFSQCPLTPATQQQLGAAMAKSWLAVRNLRLSQERGRA